MWDLSQFVDVASGQYGNEHFAAGLLFGVGLTFTSLMIRLIRRIIRPTEKEVL